ncbi:MAG: hypothetical protein ACTII7_07695 [Galactobacter sp.]
MTYTRGATWPQAARDAIRRLQMELECTRDELAEKDVEVRRLKEREKQLCGMLTVHNVVSGAVDSRPEGTPFRWDTPECRDLLNSELARVHSLNPTPPGAGARRLAEIDAELDARHRDALRRSGPGRFMATHEKEAA